MNKYSIKKEEISRAIYAMKAIAIFCVVCAHSMVVLDSFSQVTKYCNKFMMMFAPMGVAIFFAVSGFLFFITKTEDKSFKVFIQRKLKTICLPWIVSATLIFVYEAVRKGGNVSSYLKSVVGYGSSFWFLTVLVILYLVYFVINKKFGNSTIANIALMLVSVASVLLRACGIIPQNELGVYLNPLNWTLFFSLGALAAKYDKVIDIIRKFKYLWGTITIVVFLVFTVFNIKYSYFEFCYIPIAVAFLFLSVCLSEKLSRYSFICYVGKTSFFLYLYTELGWCGIVRYFGNLIDLGPIVILRPFLVILFTLIELQVLLWCSRKLNIEKQVSTIIGYKR